ncbi:MAG: hypothetical protein R2713_17630 [Ilumatobacteraceae bacterium]
MILAGVALRRPRTARQRKKCGPVHRIVDRVVARSVRSSRTGPSEKALEFLISWAGDGVEANFRDRRVHPSRRADDHNAFGVAFQFPVLLVGMQLVGVILRRR